MTSSSTARAAPHLPSFAKVAHFPTPAHGDDAGRTEHHSTLVQALTALSHIMDRQLPADPRTFEIWYVYATGSNAALNRALDQLMAQNGWVWAADLDTIYQRFFTTGRPGAQARAAADKLSVETNRVLAMLEAAVEAAGGYQTNLAGAQRQLAHADGRDGIRALVERLVSASKEMELEHERLQARLRSSLEEIDSLKADLEATHSESKRDALTRLANRKEFDARLAFVIAQCADDAAPLSLLMCDIDHFKQFNDRFGHVTGDHVLRLVAGTIKQNVRGRDVPARYGGEEFAVILPDTTLVQAAAVGMNVRGAIARRGLMRRSTGESLGHVTVSVGAAQWRPGESAQALIARADGALYAAKRQGRDRVVCDGAGG